MPRRWLELTSRASDWLETDEDTQLQEGFMLVSDGGLMSTFVAYASWNDEGVGDMTPTVHARQDLVIRGLRGPGIIFPNR